MRRNSTRHISALQRGEWSASRSSRFFPQENPARSHWTGGWVTPAPVDGFENSNIFVSVGKRIPIKRLSKPTAYGLHWQQSCLTNRYVLYIQTLWTVISFCNKSFLFVTNEPKVNGVRKSRGTRPENMGCIRVQLSTAVYSEHASTRGGFDHQLSCP